MEKLFPGNSVELLSTVLPWHCVEAKIVLRLCLKQTLNAKLKANSFACFFEIVWISFFQYQIIFLTQQ